MEKVLRGHHVLCVHGFQGMGYSPEFVRTMTGIVGAIRDERVSFPIRVIAGLDDACGSCPNQGDGICRANEQSEAHVRELDRRVMERLGLEDGQICDKEWLVRHTAANVEPDDLDELCKGCSWLQYGVCKEGIERLRQKVGVSGP